MPRTIENPIYIAISHVIVVIGRRHPSILKPHSRLRLRIRLTVGTWRRERQPDILRRQNRLFGPPNVMREGWGRWISELHN